jgi:hypothetical protein
MEFEQILEKLIDAGYDFSMGIAAKRMEVDGVRDFYGRVVWKLHNETTRTTYESDWEGFETVEEAIENIKKNFKNMEL